jgi:hypothetical protein
MNHLHLPRPVLRGALTGCLLTGCCLAAAAGCQSFNEPIYITAPMPLSVGGMDATGAANPARVTEAVVLRFRQPSATEQKTLDDDTSRLGFNVPWLQRDHIHLELLFTVQNTDQKAGSFTLGVDGANEYTKYDESVVAAAFTAVGDDPVYIPLIQPTPMILGAGQTYQGTVREDDFVEGELDLDAIGRWMAPFTSVLINRSDVNPIGLEMVPPNVVIPAMQEIDLTLSSSTTMTCTFLVRVRDDNDQLLHDTGDQLFVPMPAVFMPTVMADN